MDWGHLYSNAFDYVSAVWGYWIAAMVWVAFMTGDLASWGGFRERLDRLFPKERRRPFEVAVMLGLVFWAGFQAWQDEKSKFEATEHSRGGAVQWLSIWKARADERWHEIHDPRGLNDKVADLQKRLADALNKPPKVIYVQPLKGRAIPQAPTVAMPAEGLATEPPRDPDTIYQLGDSVANVTGAFPDLANGEFRFVRINGTGNLNTDKDFEYREYVLHFSHADMIGNGSMGGRAFQMWTNVICKIVGKRK